VGAKMGIDPVNITEEKLRDPPKSKRVKKVSNDK
jgi:hypothetical protein